MKKMILWVLAFFFLHGTAQGQLWDQKKDSSQSQYSRFSLNGDPILIVKTTFGAYVGDQAINIYKNPFITPTSMSIRCFSWKFTGLSANSLSFELSTWNASLISSNALFSLIQNEVKDTSNLILYTIGLDDICYFGSKSNFEESTVFIPASNTKFGLSNGLGDISFDFLQGSMIFIPQFIPFTPKG